MQQPAFHCCQIKAVDGAIFAEIACGRIRQPTSAQQPFLEHDRIKDGQTAVGVNVAADQPAFAQNAIVECILHTRSGVSINDKAGFDHISVVIERAQ